MVLVVTAAQTVEKMDDVTIVEIFLFAPNPFRFWLCSVFIAFSHPCSLFVALSLSCSLLNFISPLGTYLPSHLPLPFQPPCATRWESSQQVLCERNQPSSLIAFREYSNEHKQQQQQQKQKEPPCARHCRYTPNARQVHNKNSLLVVSPLCVQCAISTSSAFKVLHNNEICICEITKSELWYGQAVESTLKLPNAETPPPAQQQQISNEKTHFPISNYPRSNWNRVSQRIAQRGPLSSAALSWIIQPMSWQGCTQADWDGSENSISVCFGKIIQRFWQRRAFGLCNEHASKFFCFTFVKSDERAPSESAQHTLCQRVCRAGQIMQSRKHIERCGLDAG